MPSLEMYFLGFFYARFPKSFPGIPLLLKPTYKFHDAYYAVTSSLIFPHSNACTLPLLSPSALSFSPVINFALAILPEMNENTRQRQDRDRGKKISLVVCIYIYINFRCTVTKLHCDFVRFLDRIEDLQADFLFE